MRSSWIRVGPKSHDWCLYERKEKEIWMWRDRRRGDSLVKMKVEVGVMLSQAMGHMKPPEAERGKVGLLSGVLGGIMALATP